MNPIGGGVFEIKVDEKNVYYFDNGSLTVYYEFRGEGRVELDADEIPGKIKKIIMNYVPGSVKEDLISYGW